MTKVIEIGQKEKPDQLKIEFVFRPVFSAAQCTCYDTQADLTVQMGQF